MLKRVSTHHTHLLSRLQLVYVEPIRRGCLLAKCAASNKFMRAERCESRTDDRNTRAAVGRTASRIGDFNRWSARNLHGSGSVSGKLRVATRPINKERTLRFTGGRNTLE